MKLLSKNFNRYKNLLLILLILLGVGARVFKLGQIPIGYTFDEVAIAYDAWSISEWGVDLFLHPNPKVFESLGDFKAPLMIYLVSVIYDNFDFALIFLRIISALSGLFTVVSVYGISKSIWKSNHLATIASILTLLSPWSIHMSRVGFEANLALAFFSVGLFLFFWGKSKVWWNSLASGLWGLSIITYHSFKITVPIIFVFTLVFINRKNTKKWLLSIFPALILIIFYKTYIFDLPNDALGRGTQTLIFFNQDGGLLNNILSHLKLDWWIGGNQPNLRHLIKNYGVILWAELPLLIIGFASLWKKNKQIFFFLFSWLIIGLIPSVISTVSPHSIRAIMIIPTIYLVIAFGIESIIKHKFIFVLLVLFIVQYTLYLNNYFTIFPYQSAKDHQFGYFEAIDTAQKKLDKSKKIIITTEYGPSKYHMLIGAGISPANLHAGKFSHSEFKSIQWPNQETNTVYIATPKEIPIDDPAVFDVIKVPKTQEAMFVIAEK